MAVPFNDGAGLAAPRYWDLRQGKLGPGGRSYPYDSKEEMLAALDPTIRCEGLIGYVKATSDRIDQYQFVDGIEDENLVQITGPITGSIAAPGGSFELPSGMYLEMAINGTGLVSVGTTEAGTEITGEIVDVVPGYVANIGQRFLDTTTIYITTENDITYEIYKAR